MENDILHHVYNRGAHKEIIFREFSDYQRMMCLLYVANGTKPFKIANIKNINFFEVSRGKRLVDIVAYCLMPNHFHLALVEKAPYGITLFIHKLCTAYSGYYNRKYDHSGTIWQGPYKNKLVIENENKHRLISYIHLNPYGIKEPQMTKEARAEHFVEAVQFSKDYEYSSFNEYLGKSRSESAILSEIHVKHFNNFSEAKPLW